MSSSAHQKRNDGRRLARAALAVLVPTGVVAAACFGTTGQYGLVFWTSAAATFAISAGALVLLDVIVRPLAAAVDRVRRCAAGDTSTRSGTQGLIRRFRDLAHTLNTVADRVDERELQYSLVSEATGDVVWEWNARTSSVVWAGELRKLFGVASDRFEAGSSWWHARVHPLDRDAVEQRLDAAMSGTARRWSDEYRFRHEDGTYRWFWDRGIFLRDAEGNPLRLVGCMTDISAQRDAEERIWQLANQDELTGLPNRKVFHGRLNALKQSPDGAGALLLIDIDHFKDVNDSLGHQAGDTLLRAVSTRLKASVGESGTVFRLGGDEFAILLAACDHKAATDIAAAALATLSEPVVVADQMMSPRATIGIVLYPDHGRDPEVLLQNADLALYEGKNRGRNQAVLFAPTLRAVLEKRMSLLGEVRIGILMQRFAPHYQPIVSLRDGSVQSVEALMRWDHPERGLLAPGSFFPAFDDAELALKLGDRLIECVLRDYRRMEDAGLAPAYMAINVSSAVSRLPDLADRLLERLQRGGMPPSRLGVELTETLLFGEHAELIGATIRKLHAAGVRIALDDFGTGYASLTHLQKFPVDAIKIDQSFVRAIATDPGSQAITSAVLELGRRLGKDVIAEGVETGEHADILRAAGCRLAQGFYFARPMSAEALMTYMLAERDRAVPAMQAKAG